MFDLIRASRKMYKQIRCEPKPVMIAPPIDHAAEQRQVDALFTGISTTIEAIPHVIFFIMTCWLSLELSYQRYSYFRTRYRSENL